MRVVRATPSGACYGVQRALSMVDDAFAESERTGLPVCTLGSLIHNPIVVQELEEAGARVVDSADELDSGILVIRSHGALAGVADGARARGIVVFDATCPHVAKAQMAASRLASEGRYMVILGEAGHPEVEAIRSYAGERAVVIQEPEELPEFDSNERIGLVVQTTQSQDRLTRVVAALEASFDDVAVENTICSATRLRQEAALSVAEQVDAMIVIGGRDSGNTTRLREICEGVCEHTYHIESVAEIDPSWLVGCEAVGVTAGASTPQSHIDAVIAELEGPK